jgi:hypothetical protein
MLAACRIALANGIDWARKFENMQVALCMHHDVERDEQVKLSTGGQTAQSPDTPSTRQGCQQVKGCGLGARSCEGAAAGLGGREG